MNFIYVTIVVLLERLLEFPKFCRMYYVHVFNANVFDFPYEASTTYVQNSQYCKTKLEIT